MDIERFLFDIPSSKAIEEHHQMMVDQADATLALRAAWQEYYETDAQD